MYDELVSLGWSVVTYDGRGCGASDRDVDDYTLDGKLRDLEAVIEPIEAERFALCGTNQGGPTAISSGVDVVVRGVVQTDSWCNVSVFLAVGLVPIMLGLWGASAVIVAVVLLASGKPAGGSASA